MDLATVKTTENTMESTLKIEITKLLNHRALARSENAFGETVKRLDERLKNLRAEKKDLTNARPGYYIEEEKVKDGETKTRKRLMSPGKEPDVLNPEDAPAFFEWLLKVQLLEAKIRNADAEKKYWSTVKTEESTYTPYHGVCMDTDHLGGIDENGMCEVCEDVYDLPMKNYEVVECTKGCGKSFLYCTGDSTKACPICDKTPRPDLTEIMEIVDPDERSSETEPHKIVDSLFGEYPVAHAIISLLVTQYIKLQDDKVAEPPYKKFLYGEVSRMEFAKAVSAVENKRKRASELCKPYLEFFRDISAYLMDGDNEPREYDPENRASLQALMESFEQETKSKMSIFKISGIKVPAACKEIVHKGKVSPKKSPARATDTDATTAETSVSSS